MKISILFASLSLLLSGCLTPLQETPEDKAVRLEQEKMYEQSSHVAERAAYLVDGMTQAEAETVLNWPLKLESQGTMGGNTTTLCNTDVIGGYPNVYLTFYDGKLSSWTIIPQH